MEKFRQLLESYLNGRLSNRELATFLAALDVPEHQDQVLEYLETKLQEPIANTDGAFVEKSYEALVELINNRMQDPGSGVLITMDKSHIERKFFQYAAVIIGIVMISAIWYQLVHNRQRAATEHVEKKDVKQHDSLSYTYIAFADGTTLVLDSQAANSQYLQKLGATVDYRNRRLLLPTGGGPPGTINGMNMLVTPRGCQYSVVLPDGTTVSLNAMSQLQFPFQFSDRDRKVILNGEGFFDVTTSAGRPFQVAIGPVTLTVIGTRFNVNAYNSSPTLRTTLLRGKVEVFGERRHYALSAGQQLTIAGGEWKVSRAPDTSRVVAWRRQLFDFRKANLKTIMPELSRWYDITYEIPPHLNKTFTGKIPMTADIITVLEILKASGMHYRKEGKKISFY